MNHTPISPIRGGGLFAGLAVFTVLACSATLARAQADPAEQQAGIDRMVELFDDLNRRVLGGADADPGARRPRGDAPAPGLLHHVDGPPDPAPRGAAGSIAVSPPRFSS